MNRPIELRGATYLMLIAVTVILMISMGCGGQVSPGTSTPPTAQAKIRLNGAGATFPFPLYSKWFDEYARISRTLANYQSIGSGGGIRQITERTVDFGASDGIMSDEEEKKAERKNGPILHIPMTMGAVAIVYNISEIATNELKLTGDIIADIYLKKINRWDDSRISEINPGLNLPSREIAVIHRADGSGTTYIFTNYLSKVSPAWKERVGYAKAVAWPGDMGGQGNEGVAGQVRQIPGSIGYVELAYATQSKMTRALLRNSSGNYVEPSLVATSMAAQGVALPNDMKVMITNSSNDQAYPIAGFTWILVYQQETDCMKGKALVDLLWWAIHDGQRYAEPLEYAPLPIDAVTEAENQIRSIRCNGNPLKEIGSN